MEKILGKDERLRVRRNSIVYVTTDETFLLPHYLAVRFNLHITLVHCGFLLGTGPLVDPGFCGQLLIPLHNLTNNDYEIKRGEEIIWVEFTKTSPIHGQAGGALANFQRFPDQKKNLEPHHYFGKALERVKRSSKAGILSSLGGVESDIKEFSRKTKEDVDEIKNWGLLALLALLFTVASILMSGYILVNGVKSDLSDSSRSIGELLRSVAVQPSQQEYNRLVLRVELLERELEQVKAKKEERQADP
ncbi:MAG: hypothetical protein GVY36_20345 [Verrucomicrobia bacterium]|nr:hypothetical protein [Verrucomicrobiota bacterium]